MSGKRYSVALLYFRVMYALRRLSGRQERFLIVSAFLFLGFLVYDSSLTNDFVNFDDGSLVTDNTLVKENSLQSWGEIFTTYDPELYVPLTTLSYKLDFLVHELAPFGYHLTNLLLHILNALLLAWFLSLLSGRKFVGIVAGLLFLVHPMHSEAVSWVSARKDLLSGTFFLGSLITYLFFQKKEGDPPSWRAYFSSLALFLFGALSKVTIALLPFILLLLDWYRGRKIGRKALLEKVPFAGISILFIIIAFLGKTQRMELTELLWEKLLIACKAITFIAVKLSIPMHLSVLYPYTTEISLLSPDLLFSLIVVLALSVLAFLLFFKEKTKVPLFAWGFFLLTLGPSLLNSTRAHNRVIDFYFFSDRYAYLPSIAFFLLIALGMEKFWRKQCTIVLPSFLGILLLFSVFSYKQSHVWKNTESLFQNVLLHYPNSHVAHAKIGEILMERGEWEDALSQFQASIDIRGNSLAYYYIGLMMLQAGSMDQAKLAFGKAIEASPIDTPSYLVLAQILVREGKRDEAIALLSELLSRESALREGLEDAKRMLLELLREDR